VNADHQCLHNSIMNLVQLIPADDMTVEEIDALIKQCIERVETAA
jgi:hypothetical protein